MKRKEPEPPQQPPSVEPPPEEPEALAARLDEMEATIAVLRMDADAAAEEASVAKGDLVLVQRKNEECVAMCEALQARVEVMRALVSAERAGAITDRVLLEEMRGRVRTVEGEYRGVKIILGGLQAQKAEADAALVALQRQRAEADAAFLALRKEKEEADSIVAGLRDLYERETLSRERCRMELACARTCMRSTQESLRLLTEQRMREQLRGLNVVGVCLRLVLSGAVPDPPTSEGQPRLAVFGLDSPDYPDRVLFASASSSRASATPEELFMEEFNRMVLSCLPGTRAFRVVAKVDVHDAPTAGKAMDDVRARFSRNHRDLPGCGLCVYEIERDVVEAFFQELREDCAWAERGEA